MSPSTPHTTARRRFVRRLTGSLAGAGLLVLGTMAGAGALSAPAPDRLTGGSLQVVFVDRDGHLTERPLVEMDGLAPGAEATSRIAVRATGTLPASYRIVADDLQVSGAASPGEVLRVTVRDASTGDVEFHGRISELAIDGSGALAPGTTEAHILHVAWPANEDAARYQGAGLTFDLRAESTAA